MGTTSLERFWSQLPLGSPELSEEVQSLSALLQGLLLPDLPELRVLVPGEVVQEEEHPAYPAYQAYLEVLRAEASALALRLPRPSSPEGWPGASGSI